MNTQTEATSFADAVGAEEAQTREVETNVQTFKYFFQHERLKDSHGRPIKGEEGKGPKHPDVTLFAPVPTPEELIAYLAQYSTTTPDGKKTVEAKVADLILDNVYSAIFAAGKGQILEFREDNPEATFTTSDFDLNKLTLEHIASQEKASRGAWAPSAEELESFCEDYAVVLLTEGNYEKRRVDLHCDLIKKGFAKIKRDEASLGKMQDFLTMYASRTENMGANADTYGWLLSRIEKYLASPEKTYADAL
jgi:hypothetical protein